MNLTKRLSCVKKFFRWNIWALFTYTPAKIGANEEQTLPIHTFGSSKFCGCQFKSLFWRFKPKSFCSLWALSSLGNEKLTKSIESIFRSGFNSIFAEPNGAKEFPLVPFLLTHDGQVAVTSVRINSLSKTLLNCSFKCRLLSLESCSHPGSSNILRCFPRVNVYLSCLVTLQRDSPQRPHFHSFRRVVNVNVATLAHVSYSGTEGQVIQLSIFASKLFSKNGNNKAGCEK